MYCCLQVVVAAYAETALAILRRSAWPLSGPDMNR
jgi:hypothetical protein